MVLLNKKNIKKELLLNAFTLIELLAVIIILAIIALIAVPMILDVVEDARISAGKSEAQMILGGINNYCATEDVKYQMDNSYTKICTTDLDAEKVKEMVNLGNAEILEIAYSGKLIWLKVKSNNHVYSLQDNTMVEGDFENPFLLTKVLKAFPYLEVVKGGCKIEDSEKNYSYMGGCYLKNKQTNNYLWYSGFLWRIMGINADGTVRLITEDPVTDIPFGNENEAKSWDESYAKDWLNNYFYNKLKGNDIIVEEIWCSEPTEDKFSKRTTCENNLSSEKAKVGLLTLDEYNLSGVTGTSSSDARTYLKINQYQWSITPKNSIYFWVVRNYAGSDIHFERAFSLGAVINVVPNSVITGGNGTVIGSWNDATGPYLLNDNKNMEIKGKIKDNSISGEYVLFADKKYRVVDKDNNGNVKLILDGYYEENGDIYKIIPNGNIFNLDSGIAQKLNNDVLNWITNNSDVEKEKLVTDYIWYQGELTNGQNYRKSLEENDLTKSIKAAVGLIRVGEMLSSQSSSVLTKGYTEASNEANANLYWTMTRKPSPSNSLWYINQIGYSQSSNSFSLSLIPVIVIKSDVEIIGGTGTFSNPYQI